jgi:hypothetical protein
LPEIFSFEKHQIDHVIAEKHGGRTIADNLALSCTSCNQRKGSDLASVDPETDEVIRLFRPRLDRWSDHFKLEGGYILPLTPIGRVTVRLLQFNQTIRVAERELLVQLGVIGLNKER